MSKARFLTRPSDVGRNRSVRGAYPPAPNVRVQNAGLRVAAFGGLLILAGIVTWTLARPLADFYGYLAPRRWQVRVRKSFFRGNRAVAITFLLFGLVLVIAGLATERNI
jgi:hypothetical protein